MPKAPTPRAAVSARRHNPLGDDIFSAGHLRTNSNKRKSRADDDEDEAGNHYVDARASRKILQIGQDLAEEEVAEHRAAIQSNAGRLSAAFDFSSRFDSNEQLSDEEKFSDDDWGDEEREEAVENHSPTFTL
jgi:essential nuclear protein 1